MTLYRTPGRSFTRPPRTSTMECSCKLWPMPGMYVVTSTELVKRTRATLRNAEFGFFGVCVYTRMHTPRFSGQPINAGDFVFTWTFSRPMRTSCENVGTVIPSFARSIFCLSVHPITGRMKNARLSQARSQNARERTAVLKGLLRIRRYHQQETPYALQKVELFFWHRFGEAHSALRGWRPIPAALLSHSVLLCSGTEDIPSNSNSRATFTPAKHGRIRKTPKPA